MNIYEGADWLATVEQTEMHEHISDGFQRQRESHEHKGALAEGGECVGLGASPAQIRNGLDPPANPDEAKRLQCLQIASFFRRECHSPQTLFADQRIKRGQNQHSRLYAIGRKIQIPPRHYSPEKSHHAPIG